MNTHLQKVAEIIIDNLSNGVQRFSSGKSVLLTGAGGFLEVIFAASFII